MTLAPDAQKLLAMTAPILDQIQAAKKELEDRGLKDNNHDFYFARDRIKYAAGLDSGTTGLIAKLSMAGILGASRILKGGASRTKQIFQEAQQHTPNVWKDSPKLVYDKLSQMETSIQNGNAALYEEQRSGTAPPVKPGMLPPKSSASGPTQAPKIKILSVTAVSP